jgi:hypothetical protein
MGRRDRSERQLADGRDHIGFERAAPLLPMFGIAPAFVVIVEVGIDAIGESCHLDDRGILRGLFRCGLNLGDRHRIDTVLDLLAFVVSLLAGRGE